MFCYRSKVRDVRDTAGAGTGYANSDFTVESPFRALQSGAAAIGGPNGSTDNGREALELTPTPAMPRVFNGDYRQVPTETDNEDAFI